MQEQIIGCRDWAEFKNQIIRHLFGDAPFERGVFLFRGQSDARWKLKSSFDRWFETLGLSFGQRVPSAARLADLFHATLKKSHLQESRNQGEFSDSRLLLALGQHYGLPTRLLDWTESPYIAAFFALQGALEQAKAGGQVAVWALDTRHYIWKGQGVTVFSGPPDNNARLRNQDGLFTLLESPASCLEEHLAAAPPSGDYAPLYKFQIPAGEAHRGLRDLDVMGINAVRLYPDLTGCVLNAKMEWLFRSLGGTHSAGA